MRAPFFADFASGRRPISKKPIAGFVTAREHRCDKIPHEKPPTSDHTALWNKGWCVQRRDGPGSGAVQHGDGSAGAPPRGVAIGARIERAGCCAAPLARRSSSTSRIGRRGARRAHARLCERRGVCPPVVACATAAVKARLAANASRRSLSLAVDATCSSSSVFRGGGARSVVTTGGGGGSARAVVVAAPSTACGPPFSARRNTNHGSSSGAGRRHGGRRRGGASSIQCASSSTKKYPPCARQSGSSGAGVTALEREPPIKTQRDPPFPRAARNFKCKMTPNPLPPAIFFARERANHHFRSLCERRSVARARRTTQRGLAQPPRPATPHSNGGLELPDSVDSPTALRACPRFQLPVRARGKWGWGERCS